MSDTTEQRARFLRFITADEAKPSRLHRLLQECLEVREGDRWVNVVSYELSPSKEHTTKLTVTLRLLFFEADDDLTQKIVSFKDEEISFGDLPMMTERGTFFIDGEERELKPQRALPSGVYFSRQGKNAGAHIVLSRDDGDTMGCAELEITRHRKGDLSLHFKADPKVPISYLLPKLDKKKDLPTKFAEIEELSEWIRQNIALVIVNKSATRESVSSLQEAFSRSLCSLLVKQEQIWLPLEDIPEGLRLAEHITDTFDKLIVPRGALVHPHLAALHAAGIKELLITQASLHLFIAAEDGYDQSTGEVLFECGQELIWGRRNLSAEHELTLSAVYCDESFDEKSEVDVWRMSQVRALSPRGKSAFTDELNRALRAAQSFERRETFAGLVEVCGWLLRGLSKTQGVFLPKPSEPPLFDATEIFAQTLWTCLQQLRATIRRALNKEQNKERLIPSDLVQTQSFATNFLAALKARSQP